MKCDQIRPTPESVSGEIAGEKKYELRIEDVGVIAAFKYRKRCDEFVF
jgi:hypothetical protein